ncbi:hypothetical protein AHF37_06346 [Paragonimus kellicotti]|nr:hypothetical protein AHF37_06346 [Paragonimus kellicotti]
MEDFSVLCDRLRMTTGHKHRTKIISDFLHDSSEYGFGGDLDVLFRCLLPKESKLVYYIKDKQLVNLFSQVFERDKDEMLSDLEKAEDAATTIGDYFASTDCAICPAYKSTLTLQEVDTFLRKLSAASKEPDRLQLLTTVTRKCTVRDLVSLIRLICHDLRINAGCKQILDGLHPQAYAAFQASRDLQAVIRKVSDSESLVGSDVGHSSTRKPKFSRELNTGIRLMTPIKPMLA